MTTIKKSKSPADGIRLLIRELLAFARGRALATLILMVLAAALEGTGLLFLGPMLQLIGIGSSTHVGGFAQSTVFTGFKPTLSAALAAYVLLISLHAIVCWWRDVGAALLEQGFVDDLRKQLFHAIGSAEWEFLVRTNSAEFSHALITDLGRVHLAVNAGFEIAMAGTVALAYLLLVLHLSIALTAATMVIGVMTLSLLRRHHRNAHELGRQLTQSSQRLHGEVSELLAGLKLAKSANAETWLSERFVARVRDARTCVLSFTQKQAAARGFVRVGAAIALALLVYAAIAILSMPVSAALVLVVVFARLFPFLSSLQQQYERLVHSLPAYSAFVEMRARCLGAMEPAGGEESYPIDGAICLDRVSYTTANAGAEIVREVSLEIPWRKTTALVGPSGAGKSTLADLLAGLLAPTTGRMLIEGIEVAHRRAWRQNVAYVTQDTFLFNASARENLLWANSDITEAGIWTTLEQVAGAEFVRALPHGLNTILGERGVRLSGGERQRLAIARALLRKPQLLILDEATSSLDHANEQRIQSALANLHGYLTIVVIAHRLTTVRDADQVVVMQNGRIQEIGAYAALAATHGSYLRESLSQI